MKDIEFHSSDSQPSLLQTMLNQVEKDLELTQLRARVKELEQKESNLFTISNDMIKRRDARIRELEEAMPDAFRLRVIAGACNELRQHTAEGSLLKMADKIEKVMKR